MTRGPYKEINGGLVAPIGFTCHGVSCGIKDPKSSKKDLALVVSDRPAVAAATFTTNRVKAAPLRVSAAHLRSTTMRAMVVNSGNANACTGPRGIEDAKAMAEAVASEMGVRPTQVLVNSTGIIGVPLPMDRMLPKFPKLVKGLHNKSGLDFAKAIMTSDTVPKSLSIEVPLGKTTAVRIAAACKGAGMICPNMATMLCFVTTDVAIGKAALKQATQGAVEHSFNRITVDGDMSTNDTVAVLANGAAGNRELQAGTPAYRKFCAGLDYLLARMARMIVGDGERVTKLVEVDVRGARTEVDARRVAEAVANSTLVKCSWNGEDPNWGRIMHAVGYSKAKICEETIDIYFGGLVAAKNGLVAPTPLSKLQGVVRKPEFTVTIDLNIGDADYSVLASDISQEYVDYNRTEYSIDRLR